MELSFSIVYNHIAGFIQAVLQVATVMNIVREEWKVKRLLIGVTIIYIPHVVLQDFIGYDNIVLQIVWAFSLFAVYRIAFQIQLRKSSIMAICHMIANSCLEYILILIISLLPGDMQLYITDYLHISRSIVILIFLTFFVISQRLVRRGSHNIELRIRSLWFVYLIFMYILIDPIVLRIEQQNQPYVNNQSEMMNVVLLVILLVFNLAYIQKIRKTALIAHQLELKEVYSGSLEKSSDALRGFKHDFSNIINTINGYVDLGDLEALKNYMKALNTDILSISTTNIVNSELKKFPMLYGMLLSKLSVAELRGIAFEVSLQCEVDHKYCSVVDFSRMIGILLDNAIDAATDSEDKSVMLEINKFHGRQCIVVINTCNQHVDIEQIFQSGYTTKQSHDGEGLYQFRLLIEKYRKRGYDIDLQTSCQGLQFCQILKV